MTKTIKAQYYRENEGPIWIEGEGRVSGRSGVELVENRLILG